MSGGAVSIAIGGTAQVCCVHNRVKREVTQLAFDPVKTSIHLCSCCENVFLQPSDQPMFCSECNRTPVHALGGPLPDAVGRI